MFDDVMFMFVDYPSVQLNLVLSAPSTRYSVEAESKAKENENITNTVLLMVNAARSV